MYTGFNSIDECVISTVIIGRLAVLRALVVQTKQCMYDQ